MTFFALSNNDPRWVWALNWNQITPRIVIGSCPMSGGDLDRIRSGARVTALLSLQHDECHAHLGINYDTLRRHGARLGLTLARHPIRDFDAADARRQLPGAVRALDGLLETHERVYVHCTAGMGRAPLTVLGHLVFVQSTPFDEALALLRSRRPMVCPNIEAYWACRDDLMDRHGGAIARRLMDLEHTKPQTSPAYRRRQAEQEVLREALRHTDRTQMRP
jgi:atypical dual specificity phosphatase